VALDSLSPAKLFADVLLNLGTSDLTVVAPDEGARERCEAVRREAGIDSPVAYLRKRRDPDGVTHSALVGDVSPRAAIVDDILDTGGTLLSACAGLQRAGVQEITVLATHGLFTGERWRELSAHGVRRLYTTDSVPSAREHVHGIVEVLPVGELIADAFAAIALRDDASAAPVDTGPAAIETIEGPAPTEDSSVP
jgi:ribose-phosphate pyrophosphokinase